MQALKAWLIETSNGKLRYELLNRKILMALEEARILIEEGVQYVRTNSSLGYRPPASPRRYL